MVTNVDTAGLQKLLTEGAQVVEVLPRSEFDSEHLPGARSLPLTDLTATEAESLDRDRPVVVYCFDYQCDLSPRAAHRLEALGFEQVFDYVAGKAAWLGDGLPSEGARRPEQRIASIADRDAPTLPSDATVGDARRAFDATDEDALVVLDPHRVVVGVLRRATTGLDPATPVSDVLQPGPSTFRPSMTIKEMVEWFERTDQPRAIVSTLGGEWIGLIRRSDVVPER